MCVKTCECNNCYKRKTCADCPYVPDAPECHTIGVHDCNYRVPYPNEEAINGSGCKQCPITRCDAQYRGSHCKYLRGQHGLGDPLMSDKEINSFIRHFKSAYNFLSAYFSGKAEQGGK